MSEPRSFGKERVHKTLEGSRISLKPFKEEHISDRYIGWLNDPEVNRFLEVRFAPQTYETVRSYVRAFYGDVEQYIWGIYPSDRRDLIGTATLHDINPIHGWGSNGLMIGEREYWGKGVSTEAIDLIAEFAFDVLGLRRLIGGSYAPNHGMNFTFKRLGFTREGELRRAYLLSPGVYVDGYLWGLLVEEWRSRRQRGS